jgi:hypothetical protein
MDTDIYVQVHINIRLSPKSIIADNRVTAELNKPEYLTVAKQGKILNHHQVGSYHPAKRASQ